jgi:thiamine-phosphate pyrophosphorylase
MEGTGAGWDTLHDVARRLKSSANAAPRRDLPALFFFTDPQRTPEPWAVAAGLAEGSGVVFRAFGAADAVATGRRLAEVCRERGLVLLAGADGALAQAIGAHGVHLPERLADEAPRLRAAHPAWILTAAAHCEVGLRLAAKAGVDAALLSPVFDSASPSAGAPLGAERFTALVRASAVPVYALGGVNEKTAPELLGSGAVGLAAVSAGAART